MKATFRDVTRVLSGTVLGTENGYFRVSSYLGILLVHPSDVIRLSAE